MKLLLILFLLFSFNITSKNFYEAGDSLYINESNIKLKTPLSLYSFSNKIEVNEVDPLKRKINYPLLTGLGVGYLGAGIAVHLYQANAWWKDQRVPFRIAYDWDYALWIDKLGHFYATNLLSHAFSAGLEAGNLTSEQSQVYGSIAAFLFELYIEIEDGYGPQWGFSPGDVTANFLGASFAIGQYYYPVLKNFQPKFSYIPTEKFKNNPNAIIIDDYEGQIYWMGLRMKKLLPENISNFWPSFLQIAVGMGVSNIDGSGGGQRDFYIGLDFDAETIPLYGPFWQFVKNTLNYFHFPMPGIRISPTFAGFMFLF